MIEVRFLTKKLKTIRIEKYRDIYVAREMFKMVAIDATTRNLIPAICEYIQLDETFYWVDRRKNSIQFREME